MYHSVISDVLSSLASAVVWFHSFLFYLLMLQDQFEVTSSESDQVGMLQEGKKVISRFFSDKPSERIALVDKN